MVSIALATRNQRSTGGFKKDSVFAILVVGLILLSTFLSLSLAKKYPGKRLSMKNENMLPTPSIVVHQTISFQFQVLVALTRLMTTMPKATMPPPLIS